MISELTNDAIVIKGESDNSFNSQTIAANAATGSYQIVVSDGSLLQVGNVLNIEQDNFSDDFLDNDIYANIVNLSATVNRPLSRND